MLLTTITQSCDVNLHGHCTQCTSFLLGVDYNVSDVFVLQPDDERVAVPITIFDDALPEQQEYFQLRIQSSPNFRRRTPRSVFLSITDNDRKTICHARKSL